MKTQPQNIWEGQNFKPQIIRLAPRQKSGEYPLCIPLEDIFPLEDYTDITYKINMISYSIIIWRQHDKVKSHCPFKLLKRRKSIRFVITAISYSIIIWRQHDKPSGIFKYFLYGKNTCLKCSLP